ncbi:MAG: zinc ribbon domain-containing protein [Clostridia bacterium]|nr:zinc ribbon domain-containing protein [Clostridia bacterium]
MYCAHCGRIIADNATVCPSCGTPVQVSINSVVQNRQVSQPQPVAYAQPQQNAYAQAPQSTLQAEDQPAKGVKSTNRTNGIGIVGFIYSFFSFFLLGIPFFPGFIMSCVGVGMRKQCNKSNGVAIAGLVFALIDILMVAALVYYIVFAGGLEVIEDWLENLIG